jgi:bifunctional DNA-binding transcriptional regulator/antitoxin component of YhaV-PrlF toxin-antitoxin module
MDSTVTIKGQIAIPKAMRDYLNLEAAQPRAAGPTICGY